MPHCMPQINFLCRGKRIFCLSLTRKYFQGFEFKFKVHLLPLLSERSKTKKNPHISMNKITNYKSNSKNGHLQCRFSKKKMLPKVDKPVKSFG